ncbi:hypothetical protein N9I19_14250, partial [Peribacillus sp. CSMR9]|nr:hypothetical protein [Peribacillus sp. CSMR9]
MADLHVSFIPINMIIPFYIIIPKPCKRKSIKSLSFPYFLRNGPAENRNISPVNSPLAKYLYDKM